jgi:membrane protein required for colicin V production
MSIIDIIIIIPVIWGLYKGFTKGLIGQLAQLGALLIGVWGAMKFYKFVEDLIDKNTNGFEKYLPIISFALIFIGIVIIIHLLSKLIDNVVKAAALGWINKIAGAVFGGLKYLIIVGALLVIVDKIDNATKLLEETTKTNSLLYKPTLSLTYSMFPALTDVNESSFIPDLSVLKPDSLSVADSLVTK